MALRHIRINMLNTPPPTAEEPLATPLQISGSDKNISRLSNYEAIVASLDMATPSRTARRAPAHQSPVAREAGIRQASGPFEARLARLQALALRQVSYAAQSASETEGEEAQLDRLEEALHLLEDLQAHDDIAWAIQGRQAAAHVDGLFTTWSSEQAEGELKNKLAAAGPAWEKVKVQMHAADDYEDCRGSLDAIEQEIKALRTAIYQVEEQRHVDVPPEAIAPDVLAGILREEPEGEDTGTPGKVVGDDLLSRWDRQLTETIVQLASRLQPLRASISLFRPRIEVFEIRAAGCFPSAVTALRDKYTSLEGEFSILFREFGTLKQELGEDKWLAVFRQVNKQASDMMESLERTVKRLDATPFKGPDAEKLATTFEMKAEHYGKAIPAVLNIMDTGVKNRATLNGEVIRGYDLLLQRWQALEASLSTIDQRLESARGGGMMRRALGSTSGNRQSPERRPSNPLLKSTGRTPQQKLLHSGTPRHLRVPDRSASPSPALFRRDISLDPPRSRSRLSMHGQQSLSPQKPPWNSGTAVARMPESRIPLTPGRSQSRLGSRSGAVSSLGFTRPVSGASTPMQGSRRASGIPRGTPGRNASGIPPVPPLPTHLTTETIERLSRPKAVQLGPLPPVQPAFQTPVKQQARTHVRPSTPSGIPSLKRIVATDSLLASARSIRDSNLTGVRRPSSSATSHNLRAGTALGTRSASMIPVPSPRKGGA
jgi:hypothetical protein